MKITIINGPNLNLLGKREPTVYGHDSLDAIEGMIRGKVAVSTLGRVAESPVELSFFQSNCEGAIIDALHRARFEEGADAIVINPGAYTHYSIAIRDAIAAIEIPVVEVHLSNTHAREAFREHSVVAPVCIGRVEGLGWRGYVAAVQALVDMHNATPSPDLLRKPASGPLDLPIAVPQVPPLPNFTA